MSTEPELADLPPPPETSGAGKSGRSHRRTDGAELPISSLPTKRLPPTRVPTKLGYSRVDVTAVLPSEASDPDERLLASIRNQNYIASATNRAAAWLAIIDTNSRDPELEALRQTCVAAQSVIDVGTTYQEDRVPRTGNWPDQRVEHCMNTMFALWDARGLGEISQAQIERLANTPDRVAYGLERCHRERRDFFVRRPEPKHPKALRRPASVSSGTRAHIVVRVDTEGNADLEGVINADPGPASEACFAAVSGSWSPPFDVERKQPTPYCHLVHCAF